MACTTMTTSYAAGTTVWVTAKFFDKARIAGAPATVSYRVICLTTGTTINGDGSVTPAASVDIEITDEENALVDPVNNDEEKRRVVVTAGYGDGSQHVETIDFYVRAVA